jgi:diacylglycerol O-acyltransferase / wax synthase
VATHADRLSAQDASFLLGETATSPMHVAAVQIFELGDLATPAGGVDFERFRAAIRAVLHKVPRYRQRLAWVPGVGWPWWVDDEAFRLDYHLRHTALPRPGTAQQLKRIAARVMERQLDRARPLWEMWVVEGLEGPEGAAGGRTRFATLSKVHHCMVDGASGVDLAQTLFSLAPEHDVPEPPRWLPRPAPSGVELLRAELAFRASLPLRAVRRAREAEGAAVDWSGEVRARLRAVGELMGWAVAPASPSPVNGELTPHRRFDWLATSLADVKAVRKAAGCSVNDVVLTTVAGALRDYLRRRGVDPAGLDFRVSAPVSVRRDDERDRLGNRVSSWILRLPLGEADPRARLAALHEETQRLKGSRQALGVEIMMKVAEWTPPVLLSLGARAVSGPINSIVTNVPGPQLPLYMLGARLREMYPVVPLLEGMGLAVALFSYDGTLFWGLHADERLVPDLTQLVRHVRAAFTELAACVSVAVAV